MPTRIDRWRRRTPRGSRTRALLAVLPVALALALTGCGSADDDDNGVASANDDSQNRDETPDSGDETETPSQDDMDAMMLEFAQCMRDNGVEAFPDHDEVGGMLGEDVMSDPDFTTAEAACADLMPEGQEPSAEDQQEMQDAMLAMAQCMRDNGVEDFPDPELGGPGGGGMLDESIENDPDFTAADEACRDLMGDGLRQRPGQ